MSSMVTLGVQVAERPETDIQGRAGSDQVCVRALAKSNSIHMGDRVAAVVTFWLITGTFIK